MDMPDCLFCKIVSKQIKTKLLYDDSELSAFGDINPQAPVHVLIVPKKHISSLNDVQEEDAQLLGRAFLLAKELARREGVGKGYRVLVNNGADAGQSVFHLHLHLLGGRKFGWPPG